MSLVKKFVIGAAGGLAGTLAMKYYWEVVEKIAGDDPRMRTTDATYPFDDISVDGQKTQDGEASTAAAGRLVYEMVRSDEPDEQEKKQLSQAVHWSYGALQGGLFGIASGNLPFDTMKLGAGWGTGMWALGDELAVPMLGLAKGPTEYPPSQHLHRLGAHVTFGLAAAATTKLLSALLD